MYTVGVTFLIGLLGFILGAAVVGLVLVLWPAGPVGRARAEAQASRDAVAEAQARVAGLEERAKQLEAKDAELLARDQQLNDVRTELNETGAKLAGLEAQMAERERGFEEQKEAWQAAEAKLTDTFAALAGDAMRKNREDFLALAKEQLEGVNKDSTAELEKRKLAVENMLKPIQEQLKLMDDANKRLEERRSEAYGDLKQHLTHMSEQQRTLQKETGRLIQALRNPTTRGQWGELQLRRVVEMAGMIDKVDFETQKTVQGDDGKLRPDMIINLPNGRTIVVDSKAPLEAYSRAITEDDEDIRRIALDQHAAQVRTHIGQLSSKGYQSQFEQAPDFVVMFLPGEPFFSAALERDPSLIEVGVQSNVIITTPTTLIALLRAVAAGWRQEKLSRNAQEVSMLGKELYKRIGVMGDHFGKVGKNLHTAVRSFNDTVASLEGRVLPQARKMREIAEFTEDELPEIAAIDITPRILAAPELSVALPEALPFDPAED